MQYDSDEKSNSLKKKISTPVIALLVLLGSKLKFLLVFLQFFKLGKLGGTLITMGAMAWAYSVQHGWKFAVGLVLLILIHELGHGIAAKMVRLPIGAPVFIPFVGAFIAMKEKPQSSFHEFIVGAGGPIAGTAAALVCIVLTRHTSWPTNQLLMVLGYFALTMNLFNLTPLGFLDGSRMTSALLWPEWIVGLGALGYTVSVATVDSSHVNPITTVVLLLGVVRFGYLIWKQNYESTLSPSDRVTVSIVYFGLSSFLIFIVEKVGVQLPRY